MIQNNAPQGALFVYGKRATTSKLLHFASSFSVAHYRI